MRLSVLLIFVATASRAEMEGTNLATLRISRYLTESRGHKTVEFVLSNKTAHPLRFEGYSKLNPVYSKALWAEGKWLRQTSYWCATDLHMQTLGAGEQIRFREYLFGAVTQDWRMGISCHIEEIDSDNTHELIWSDAVKGPPPDRTDSIPIPDDPSVRFGGRPLSYLLWAGEYESAEAFWHLGSAAVPPLMAVLRDERFSSSTHLAAIKAIGNIGPAAHNAIPLLIQATSHADNEMIQAGAIRALGKVAAHDPHACKAVAEKLDASDWFLRLQGITSLGKFQSLARPFVPQLIAMEPKLANRYLTAAVAMTLGDLGPDARDAMPSLRNLMSTRRDSKFDYTPERAAIALWRVGKSLEGLPILLDALKRPDSPATAVVAEHIGEYGRLAEAARTDLLALTTSSNVHVRVNAAGALHAVTGDLEPALSLLIREAKTDDYYGPGYAAAELGKIRRKPAVARNQLGQLLLHHSAFVRLQARRALSPDNSPEK